MAFAKQLYIFAVCNSPREVLLNGLYNKPKNLEHVGNIKNKTFSVVHCESENNWRIQSFADLP